ncbi:hypothetical protein [Brochothrix campestris]|uniref:Uncharacterized protein n=1 Tax=Brochothrix campestris FSL F6-1037 TaxID=1265861 RepID=W7D232_9LIST|nr:hypothetical protein [Brochothrix campestris]EUJ39328.1 hypothetical protein BCAMP_07285 [Brochothrix campestris FSL F6-1037]
MSGVKQLIIVAIIAICGVGGTIWYWQTQPPTATQELEKVVAQKEADAQGLVDDLNKLKRAAESETAATNNTLSAEAINRINSGILQATDLGASYTGKQLLVTPLTTAANDRIQTEQASQDKNGYLSDTIAPYLRQISETHQDVTTVLVNQTGESVIVIEDGKVRYNF